MTKPIKKLKIIANPPNVGIAFLLTRRSFGTSTAPIANANLRTSGVNMTDAKNTTIKVIVTTLFPPQEHL